MLDNAVDLADKRVVLGELQAEESERIEALGCGILAVWESEGWSLIMCVALLKSLSYALVSRVCSEMKLAKDDRTAIWKTVSSQIATAAAEGANDAEGDESRIILG